MVTVTVQKVDTNQENIAFHNRSDRKILIAIADDDDSVAIRTSSFNTNVGDLRGYFNRHHEVHDGLYIDTVRYSVGLRSERTVMTIGNKHSYHVISLVLRIKDGILITNGIRYEFDTYNGDMFNLRHPSSNVRQPWVGDHEYPVRHSH